ncbi:conserved hypothetical protein [Leishmania major strain Friedlin]|uniref:Uncharacterized protein n=1 Tax=Leishmania major TaxID=5664 RepID=Q4QIS2_LEIMA|nr:conserved hypothetical protein [Leishmania major strain Friedlin]CAG9568956.1 hypothetical_protein_-_conserved [Leishmania major strain Friedlin]CAJ06981.1 conserved hypothetical protein [Leishmania major strain Friedlin]|eukprot:XP_001680926.1 conserved hypothetical protein [Leishmania major strain Friedlin]
MMRCFRALRARKDIVELLVCRGRLADIQMLNFFSIQLDREVSAATAAAAVPGSAVAAGGTGGGEESESTAKQAEKAAVTAVTPDATGTEATMAAAGAATAVEAEAVAKAAAAEAQRAQSCEARKKAWKAFHDRSDMVRRLAVSESPVAWLREVYSGDEEWSCSYLTAATAVATHAGTGAPTLKASGTATAVGNGDVQRARTTSAGSEGGQHPHHGSSCATTAAHALPKSIRVVLRLEGGEDGTPKYVTGCVPLDQPGVVEKKMVNGMLQVRLNNADVAQSEPLSAEKVASYQNVLTATAYSGILRKMGEIGSLHATNTVRYDALLIRNPAVQMRLAQLACFRYGIDCLTDYVVGDPAVVDGDEAAELFSSFSEQLQIPLVESMVLKIYAERALMDGMDCMWEMVRDTPLVAAVAHRSNPAKMINYPYLAELLNASKYLLTSWNGSMEEQAMAFLHPLLSQGGLFGSGAGGSRAGIGGVLQGLIGLTTGHSCGGVRLAAPHVNLAGMAKTLELDVAKLLSVIAGEKGKLEPMFVISVAQYISEVLANLAVIYRCTAALNIDEEGRGHREWLLAQAFGGASAVRRQRIMNDYMMSRAATSVIKKSKSLDNYSTHPIELMNTSPRNAKTSSTERAAST